MANNHQQLKEITMGNYRFWIQNYISRIMTMLTLFRWGITRKSDTLFGYTVFMGWGRVAKYQQLLIFKGKEIHFLRGQLESKESEIRKLRRLSMKLQQDVNNYRKKEEVKTVTFPANDEAIPPVDIMAGQPPKVYPPVQLTLPAPEPSPVFGTPVDELSLEKKVVPMFRGPMQVPNYSDGWYGD